MCLSKAISYQELKEQKGEDGVIFYADYLNTLEWKQKRKVILERDKWKCTKCGKGEGYSEFLYGTTRHYDVFIADNAKTYKNVYVENGALQSFNIYNHNEVVLVPIAQARHLHIHHTYYVDEYLPWEYKDDCLETLCLHCHTKMHQEQVVPVYKKNDEGKYCKHFHTPCTRCYGAGILPQYHYYLDGICLRCYGARYEELISKDLTEAQCTDAEKIKNSVTFIDKRPTFQAYTKEKKVMTEE